MQGRQLAAASMGRTIRAALIGMLGMWVASLPISSGTMHLRPIRTADLAHLSFVCRAVRRATPPAGTARALIALGISYGLVLIFGETFSLEGKDVAIGAGFVMVAAIAFALYQLLAKDAIDDMGPRLFTCIAMTGASLAAFVQFFAGHHFRDLLVSGPLLFYSVLVAIGATVLPTFFMNAALHRISAQANATIGILSPVSTILLAALILGEKLTMLGVIGTLLVIGGVAWFTLRR
jgi:drug/metabolite transporter (DMT)-like permease